MGLLSQVEQIKPAATNSQSTWRNVALRVASYDVDKKITTGVDVATGETLSIKLIEPAIVGRDDVEIWSLPRFKVQGKITLLANNKAVVAGDESEAGVIIFEAVRPSINQPGLMDARWSATAAHSASDATVIQVMARPIADKGNARNVTQSLGIEMIRVQAAAGVTSKEEIAEQIANCLAQPFTQAVVRAMDEDGKVVSAVVRRPFTPELKALTSKVNAAGFEMEKAGKGFFEVRAAKRKARNELSTQFTEADANSVLVGAPTFFAEDPLGQLLSKLSAEQMQALKLEVFALEQVYPGDKYKEALNKFNGPEATGNSVDANSFRRDWLSSDQGFGFTETLAALRTHDEGGLQLTKIRPASTRPMLYMSINDIPTANIQPSVAPVMAQVTAAAVQSESAPASASAAPAAAAAASDSPAPAAGADKAANETNEALDNKLANAARSYARR